MFGAVLDRPATGRRVVAVELQGHGHTPDVDRPFSSDAFADDDVAALVHSLDPGPADLVGYSLGGGVVLRTAIRHPEVVRRLVVVAAPCRRDGRLPDVLAGMAGVTSAGSEWMRSAPPYAAHAAVTGARGRVLRAARRRAARPRLGRVGRAPRVAAGDPARPHPRRRLLGPGAGPGGRRVPVRGRPLRAVSAATGRGRAAGMTDALPAAALDGGGAMPLLGFGTWQMTGTTCYDAVRTALDAGYRHLDTATMYRNEAEVGRALRDSGVDRDEVFVTTKLPPREAGRAEATLTASLDALGLDAVDLWLVHWPPGGAGEDLWQRFVAARDAGRARAIGVSNYSLEQVDRLTGATGVTPQVNQVSWAPALYDADVESGHRERGVVLEGYSPFKNTDLQHPVLREVADAHGVTPAQVVLRWHVEHGVVVIPKSATPERIRANLEVSTFSLTGDEVARVDGLARG
ncbi:MAG TPA: aldo/keto reductase [Geodermatophilus sp.]|nr:aldo/keto reductase [Geodermatophilus sp.]